MFLLSQQQQQQKKNAFEKQIEVEREKKEDVTLPNSACGKYV